jgi:DNA processing protein
MSVCDVPVLTDVCRVSGEAAGALLLAPFQLFAQGVGDASRLVFEIAWTVFAQTTLVDVTSSGYLSVYNLMFGVGLFFMFGFFLLQLITGLVHRDPGALSRAVLGLAKSVLGSFLVITLTATLLEIVDQLCIGIVQATGNTIEGMGTKIGTLLAGLTLLTAVSPGVGAVVLIFFGSLAVTAAAILWISLLVRKALLLVSVALAPVALAGSAWDVTRGWVGKWASFVVALIASKLVVTVVLLVAVTQVDAPINLDLASLADPVAGIVLLALAGFAPYLTYRFISFIGFDLYQTLGAEQEAKQALNRPLPVPHLPRLSSPSSSQGDDAGGDSPAAESLSPPSSPPTPDTGGADSAPTSGTQQVEAAGGEEAATGATATAAAPVAAALIAAEVAKKTADAGPAAGSELAGSAGDQADAAQSSPPPQAASAPPSVATTTEPDTAPPAPATPVPPSGQPRGGSDE